MKCSITNSHFLNVDGQAVACQRGGAGTCYLILLDMIASRGCRHGKVRKAVLERLDLHVFLAKCLEGGDGGFGGLDRSDAGNSVLDRGGPNRAFVGSCAFAAGRVENQIDAFIFHVVDQVGMTLDDLLDSLDGNAGVFDSFAPCLTSPGSRNPFRAGHAATCDGSSLCVARADADKYATGFWAV